MVGAGQVAAVMGGSTPSLIIPRSVLPDEEGGVSLEPLVPPPSPFYAHSLLVCIEWYMPEGAHSFSHKPGVNTNITPDPKYDLLPPKRSEIMVWWKSFLLLGAILRKILLSEDFGSQNHFRNSWHPKKNALEDVELQSPLRSLVSPENLQNKNFVGSIVC